MKGIPTFLDIPILLVIVSLGALRPDGWTQFLIGTALAISVASALNVWMLRLYPWHDAGVDESRGTARRPFPLNGSSKAR